jgi:hypothetical protein
MRNLFLALATMACITGAVAADDAAKPAKPATPPVGKTILNVPPDARIAMLGVYQAAGAAQSPTHSGSVVVNVAPGKDPLVLVLTSYEKVNWMIHAGTRKITAVLLSSNKPSNVYGQGTADVAHIGTRNVYKVDSPEFQELRRDIARYVGPGKLEFQGAYEATRFQVD